MHLKAALSSVDEDPIAQRLMSIFDKRVGRRYQQEDLDALVRIGRQRFERKVPPGYRDAAKPDQVEEGTGDFLIWEQLLRRASALKSNVLFVTDDEKDDWWRLDADGEPIGPRVELIDEMASRAGVKLVMLRRPEFLEATLLPSGWTAEGLAALLARLRGVGAWEQETVLRSAALSKDGFITRRAVYQLARFHPDRLLVGFTRPVVTSTRHLQSLGELPDGLEVALKANYLKPGKANGFKVPRSVQDAMHALEGPPAGGD
ncbi:PIN-like domain-containing protein [Asanoa siamensis]|uniref:PIN like domain-containing protein n=1 Tax=Asanoa siamensis TaxID=926357 RepID=A0ABQ4CN49_9ACTN|nr:PIN-like domain-containing protein [Asanoa siamensis]GIF72262.1 hypothetical protein Asi02nite_17800 [Asanoa siamensis]